MKWKILKEFGGQYHISENGEIVSFKHSKTGKKMQPVLNSQGYFKVTINRKTWLVHRLVALAFHGKSSLTVNHKDLNKTNNHYTNLEYLSIGDNARHAVANGARKNRIPDSLKIINLINHGVSDDVIASSFGVSTKRIQKIKRGISPL